jgi:hypothetical protein
LYLLLRDFSHKVSFIPGCLHQLQNCDQKSVPGSKPPHSSQQKTWLSVTISSSQANCNLSAGNFHLIDRSNSPARLSVLQHGQHLFGNSH